MPVPTLEAELQATVAAGLPISPTPGDNEDEPAFGGLEGVSVLRLEREDAAAPLWAVFTLGFSFEQAHFLALYTYADGAWQQVGRVNLEFSDIMFADGVQQVEVTSQRLWIEVRSGAGAHGGVYDLLSFDGSTLRKEVSHTHPRAGAAGRLEDLNEDGTPEVILNQSDDYVFCYACGVVEVNYQVLRWDGRRMVEMMLTPLPDSAPPDLRQVTNRAIALAEAGLWQDAGMLTSEIDEANASIQDATATWNSALIRLTADARARQARSGSYPLLGSVFYGDYTAVIGIFSGYSPEEIFSLPNPLIVGTVAEGFEQALVEYIVSYTTRALEQKPDLATAYFLRGWAHYLQDPQSPAAMADVQLAADLDPAQALFTESLTLLGEQQASDPSDATAQQDAIRAAATFYMQNRVGDDVTPVVTIEKLEGDYARATIATDASEGEPLLIFLKRENNRWIVLADVDSPAEDIDLDSYRKLGIPESLLLDLPGAVSHSE
jgi:tetratricopeptide (TPR) repeat protein